MQSRMSTKGSSRLHQYFLSFGVPAKPGIAKDPIEADGNGRKAVADFIDSLLVKNI